MADEGEEGRHAGGQGGRDRALSPPSYVVVIPTIGRPSLQDCLDALAGSAAAAGYLPRCVVLADDRRDTPQALPVTVPSPLAGLVRVVTLEGRGPAAARNAGWRGAGPAEWVVFLDDDVQVHRDWARGLAADLAAAGPRVGGVQGVVEVPWPAGRRPADSQRATLGLAGARWITADMAYRRAALADAGGFDERFPRAYREDSDLALRVVDLGWTLCRGGRRVSHPVRPPDRWASLRAQAGNADDVAMRRRHGRDWRRRAGAGQGRGKAHLTTCGLGGCALVAGAVSALGPAGGRGAARRLAALAGAGWLALTAQFAVRRILAGPRTWPEAGAMAVTSVAIPPLAVAWRAAGTWRSRAAGPWPPRPAAVLFDRDGTLVRDVPYNTDPDLVAEMPGAAAAVAALRAHGIAVGVVTNQSGIGRGLISAEQLSAVNRRIDELAGPFGTWQVCPHRPDEGCRCRKPEPGLIEAAAAELGVRVADCVVIGDIAADVAAARAAGARGIVVPNAATSPGELPGLPAAATLAEAVACLLDGRLPPSWPPAGQSSAAQSSAAQSPAPESPVPEPAVRRAWIAGQRPRPSVSQFAGKVRNR